MSGGARLAVSTLAPVGAAVAVLGEQEVGGVPRQMGISVSGIKGPLLTFSKS